MSRALAVFFVGMFVSSAALAGPYAPGVMQGMKTPDAAEVGIPAYPGAKVVSMMKKPMIKGAKNRAVVLLTTDSPDKVVAFYKGKLTGWSVQAKSEQTAIYQGKGGFRALSKKGQSTQHVLIESLEGDSMLPGGKAKITVGYHPKK